MRTIALAWSGETTTVHALFPQLLPFGDFGLLLLRLMVAVVFVPSGWSHVRHSAARSQSIGMSQGFTIVLGCGEIAGGLGVALGVLTQLAALGLSVIMLGAIRKKLFVWKTGFWGAQGYGWHYDLMLLVMNVTVLLTGGGRLALW